jgi:hypothetical protein
MKKFVVLLSGLLFCLCACDNNKSAEKQPEEKTPEVVAEPQAADVSAEWRQINDEPEKFMAEFAKLDEIGKYYFCTAYTIGALSASKPTTAAAMINYFFGLGLVKYNQEMNDNIFRNFNFGKNIFRFETVAEYIREEKTCENIMVETIEYGKSAGYKAEDLNDKGKPEVEKLVELMKQ